MPQSQNPSRDATEQAKDKAKDLAEQAKSRAEDVASEQKARATDTLSSVADALHATGDQLQDEDQDAFAQYAHAAADQVQRFTDAIRQRSVGDLLYEAERFARRDPGLFVGGAVLLGIFGARFLKASSSEAGSARYGRPDRGGDDNRERFGPPYAGRTYAPTYGSPRRDPGYGARTTHGAGGGTQGMASPQQPSNRVLHTSGGEMPDPSRSSSGARTTGDTARTGETSADPGAQTPSSQQNRR